MGAETITRASLNLRTFRVPSLVDEVAVFGADFRITQV